MVNGKSKKANNQAEHFRITMNKFRQLFWSVRLALAILKWYHNFCTKKREIEYKHLRIDNTNLRTALYKTLDAQIALTTCCVCMMEQNRSIVMFSKCCRIVHGVISADRLSHRQN